MKQALLARQAPLDYRVLPDYRALQALLALLGRLVQLEQLVLRVFKVLLEPQGQRVLVALRVPPELRDQQVLLDRLVQRDQRDYKARQVQRVFKDPKVLPEPQALRALLGLPERKALLARQGFKALQDLQVYKAQPDPLAFRVQKALLELLAS